MKKTLVALALLASPFVPDHTNSRGLLADERPCGDYPQKPDDNHMKMDDGNCIRVENISSYDVGWVQGIVIAADRSTQQDGIEIGSVRENVKKGLFHKDDVIIVTDNYIAWMDLSRGDGVQSQAAPKWRSSLAGIWTLDPTTRSFKYPRLGPNGFYWAHNELIPGSASPDGQYHHWDRSAPPIEHSMSLITPECPLTTSENPKPKCFFSFEFSPNSPNSKLQRTVANKGNQVRVEQFALMTSFTGQVDIYDGDDSNGITNFVNAWVDYIFKGNDIEVNFRFSPDKDLTVTNLYTGSWVRYAQDEDGTECDTTPENVQDNLWPDNLYYEPLYTRSSETMFRIPDFSDLPPGLAYKNVEGPTCVRDEEGRHINYGFESTPSFTIKPGDWIMMGESPTLSTDKSRLRLTYLGGNIEWATFRANNETSDGTWGLKLARGRPIETLLEGKKWYELDYGLSTGN